MELRHPELWFRHSIEMVAAQVAAMKYRNLEQRQIIDEHLLRFVIAEAQDLELEELSLEELNTPIKLRNYLNEAFYGVDAQDDEDDNEPGERSSTPFADNLEDLLYRELYLPLDDNSKATIERASHIGNPRITVWSIVETSRWSLSAFFTTAGRRRRLRRGDKRELLTGGSSYQLIVSLLRSR